MQIICVLSEGRATLEPPALLRGMLSTATMPRIVDMCESHTGCVVCSRPFLDFVIGTACQCYGARPVGNVPVDKLDALCSEHQ